MDADPITFHLLRTGENVAIVHNHPSTQTLSIEDIKFFLHFSRLRLIVVVSNQGTVHYLMKDKDYDFEKAEKLRCECVEELNNNSSAKECYAAALDYLTHCSEVGLLYK